jgi:imidazoleglycerol-phosphate dehydratase
MSRSARIKRDTTETKIVVELSLDGDGQSHIETGVGFLDHMLRQVAVQGLLDLNVVAKGDLEIDGHHTVEDVAIVLGKAIDQALGDRYGIQRMGAATVPMDEALALVAVDLGGRAYAVFHATWHTAQLGQMPTSLVQHFFESLAVNARMNLHARVEYGRDDHHQAEALFKALGRALRAAVAYDERRLGIASTKGTLTE